MSIWKGGAWVLAIICLVLVFPVFVIAKEEQFTLKLATLAPEASTWWNVSFLLTFLGT